MSKQDASKKQDIPIDFGIAAEQSAGTAGAASAPEDSGLQEQVARLQAEKDELTQTLVRRQADFENYRKRLEREQQEASHRGVGRLLLEMLPVLDGFERALQAHDEPEFEEYRRGIELIYRQLWDALKRNGLERIAAKDKPFDPNFHQAIERVETREHPEGSVVDVLQDGFLFQGKVLRPSLVRVAAEPQDTSGVKPSSVGHLLH